MACFVSHLLYYAILASQAILYIYTVTFFGLFWTYKNLIFCKKNRKLKKNSRFWKDSVIMVDFPWRPVWNYFFVHLQPYDLCSIRSYFNPLQLSWGESLTYTHPLLYYCLMYRHGCMCTCTRYLAHPGSLVITLNFSRAVSTSYNSPWLYTCYTVYRCFCQHNSSLFRYIQHTRLIRKHWWLDNVYTLSLAVGVSDVLTLSCQSITLH